jgi:maleylacetate reductase
LVDKASAKSEAVGADAIVSVGGGSAVGLAKAVAVMTGLPIIAVPTTYSGSEMTDIYGITADGTKRGGRDPRASARVVIYDPLLTVSLPAPLTASTGLNALAQAIASLNAERAHPITVAVAAEGIRRMVAALPACVERPEELASRSDALLGAHLCGWALSHTGLAGHHQLVHMVGDFTRLPHANLHAAFLPQTTWWMSQRHPGVASRLSAALGAAEPGQAVFDLLVRLQLPAGLRQLGLDGDAFEALRRHLLAALPDSWQGADPGEFDDLLKRTFLGSRPPAATTADNKSAS